MSRVGLHGASPGNGERARPWSRHWQDRRCRSTASSRSASAAPAKRRASLVSSAKKEAETTHGGAQCCRWMGRRVAAINMLIDDLVWPTTDVTRAVGAVAKSDLGQSMALDVDGRPLE